MIYYVDIDETVCTTPEDRDYTKAVPIVERIKKINQLREEGHTIIYWTARGTGSGIDWRDVTEKQFEDWGVKYDSLKFGKPNYGLFVCDKATNSEVFFEDVGK